MDFYRIKIDDRIYKSSGAFPAPHPDSITADCNDIRALCTNISFFTNALDMESEGVDVVLTSVLDWSPAVSTDFQLRLQLQRDRHNRAERDKRATAVSAADVEDIENSYPNERFVVSALTSFTDKLDLMIAPITMGRTTISAAQLTDHLHPPNSAQ